LNGLSYAYLGDAYYELEIRKYLLKKGHTKVDILHKQAIRFTSSKAQAKIIANWLEKEILSEREIEAFKHGRNGAHFGRKNVDGLTYQQATGFESLIGYLSIENEQKCLELIALAIEYIEKS
jgi:ribonuclease-3 family protein